MVALSQRSFLSQSTAPLESAGWRVHRTRRGEFVYTTPAGRVGTMALAHYDASEAVWRLYADLRQVRIGMSFAVPRVIDGFELTVAPAELPALAEWLPRWMLAREAGAELPELGLAMRPQFSTKSPWTAAAAELQKAADRARNARLAADKARSERLRLASAASR